MQKGLPVGKYLVLLTKQACSTKDLPYGQNNVFSNGTKQEIPSRQDGPILPATVAH